MTTVTIVQPAPESKAITSLKTGAFVTPGDCFEVPHSMRIGYAYGKQDLIDGLKAISEYIAMKAR